MDNSYKIEPLILHKILPIDELKKLVYENRIVIIKNVDFEKKKDMLDFCRQFGMIHKYKGEELTVFSNNENIGTSKTGSHAWHIDGVYSKIPNKLSFQYIIQCPKGLAGTQFFPSDKIVKELGGEYEKYWVMTGKKIVHPLIAKHPVTDEKCIVCTRTIIEGIVEFKDNVKRVDTFNIGKDMHKIKRIYTIRETQNILRKIDKIIETNEDLIYVTDFEPGDLLVRDNMSMMHRSHPTAQIDHKKIGLRKMWRVVIGGDSKPTK